MYGQLGVDTAGEDRAGWPIGVLYVDGVSLL